MLELQEIELTRLHPWEDNPRLNDQAVNAVAESIRSFGFNVPIVCDQNLTIVAGHTRWKAAQKLGMTTVPVIVIEMTDAQRRAFSVADNKTGEIADWDFPKLREVLEELRCEDIDIGSLGFSDEEIRRLLLDDTADEDSVPELNDTPATQLGDLYGSGDSIFEPFGGSGTTLIAAEKASRSAYAMERNPAYCDAIVKRWETLTGSRAVPVAGEAPVTSRGKAHGQA